MALQRSDGPAARRDVRPASSLAGTRLWDSPFLSSAERDALAQAVSAPKSIRGATDLIREGERSDSLFVILDGWAYRYMTTRDGARQLPALLLPGDIANLDTLMFDRLEFGVRSASELSVAALPRDRALKLVAEHPGIAQTFTWLALVENAILCKWALSLGRRSARERLAHLLCELSVRLDAENGGASGFAFRLTQEQVADALGLTAVHVNRTLQQLRDDGLVVTANRTMKLPDVARLRKIGGFDPAYLHAERPARLS